MTHDTPQNLALRVIADMTGDAYLAESVKKLLDEGADLSYCDHNGVTMLYAAAVMNNPDIVSHLFQKGAVITEADHKNGILGEAAYWGFADVCRLLLAHGADPGAADAKGRTAMERLGKMPVNKQARAEIEKMFTEFCETKKMNAALKDAEDTSLRFSVTAARRVTFKGGPKP